MSSNVLRSSMILLAGCCTAVVVSRAVLAEQAVRKDPYPPAKPPLLALVQDGRSRAVIVAPAPCSPVVTHAVNELVGYVRKMTGVELRVVAAPEGRLLPIYIGGAAKRRLGHVDWEKLGADGFVLKSGAGGVYIAGAKDLGTLFGVYQLLEKHLGVRWFMPGELGEVAPRSGTLRIGTIDELETPSFRVRWIEGGDWALHQKMNVDVEIGNQPVGVHWLWSFHTHFKLIPPEKYFDSHPEWFALINGKRRRPVPGQQGAQLCTSNPELIEEMARRIIQEFDEDPSLDILALAPQDGGGFCQCASCAALDEHRPPEEAWHAAYSRRLAIFNNEVAKRVARKYPDKIIKVGAYAMYLRVPLDPDYRPAPNLAIQVCHTYSCNSHPIAPGNASRESIEESRWSGERSNDRSAAPGGRTCRGNAKYFRGELEHWAKIANHLFIYEYYNKGAWGGLPYYQVHLIREDIPYYHRLRAEGFYTQAAGGNWPACGLNHYIAAKLIWDVDLDVDKLLDDFYEKFYAEAAAPMRDYWESLRRAFADYDECLSPFGRKWTTLAAPDIFTPQVVAALEDAVSRAEKAARTSVVRQRVKLIRVRVDFTEKVMDYLRAIQSPFKNIDLNDAKAVAAAHRKAIKAGGPLSADLKQFCRQSHLQAFPRLIDVHGSLRYLIQLPDRRPILR